MNNELCLTPQKKHLHRRKSEIETLIANPSIAEQMQGTTNTPKSKLIMNRTGSFSILPVINTPPRRFPKVTNPFDAALTADRLFHPIIMSPLFRTSMTPKARNSSHFEWTIDEVSSLRSVNLEPYESQFQETSDPEVERRAQAAISSFFKEHAIVPSPMSCAPARNNYIANSILNADGRNNAPALKKTHTAACQTVLTLPSVLSPNIELMLSQYFSYNEDQQQTFDEENTSAITIDTEARDASLRRKLFEQSFDSVKSCDIQDHLNKDLGHLSPPPRSPELNIVVCADFKDDNILNKSHNIALSPVRRESFGALSPISKTDSPPNFRRRIERRCGSDSSIILIGSTPERLTRSFSSQYMEVSMESSRRNDRSDEDMQISMGQTTPLRRQRFRAANRKNLSQSFSMFDPTENIKLDNYTIAHRLDSGFNEASDKLIDYTSCNNISTSQKQCDISMKSLIHTDHLISSTPSKVK